MKIIDMPIGQIKPYDRNPRNNDAAVEPVAASIREFGFKQPIVVDAKKRDHLRAHAIPRRKAARTGNRARPRRGRSFARAG